MSECTPSSRQASITLEFDVCVEHHEYAVRSAMIEIGGVPPFDAMDGFLSCIEETASVAIAQMSPVREFLTKEWDWDWMLPLSSDDEGAGEEGSRALSERAQKWLSVRLAHQLMLSRVASRGYETSRRNSAFMSFPMSD